MLASCGRKGDSLRAGNEVRAVSVALERYVQTHAGRLPPFGDHQQLETLLLPYLRDAAGNAQFGGIRLASPLLARPETGEPYIFNSALSGKPQSEYPHPDTVVLFCESHDNYGGRLVAFLDGHHIWATAKQWEQNLAPNLAVQPAGASR